MRFWSAGRVLLAYAVGLAVVFLLSPVLAGLTPRPEPQWLVPPFAAAVVIGLLCPRRGGLHGLLFGTLLASFTVYVLALIVYHNTDGTRLFFSGTEPRLVYACVWTVVAAGAGGRVGAQVRGWLTARPSSPLA